MGKLSDYLSYGLAGAALGVGGGAGFNHAAHGKQKPLALALGAGIGAGTGALIAYMKNKNRVNPENLDPGWYIIQRPLSNLPDVGLYTRHSGNLIVLPKEQADKLLEQDGWKRTSHKDFKGKDGKELTAFTFGGYTGSSIADTILGSKPLDVRFSKAKQELEMPITDITKVPLKPNVSLVTALKRLRDINNIYSALGEPGYNPLPTSEPGLLSHGATNSHGITTSILKGTEDLHNLKEWMPVGVGANDKVKYIRTNLRPEMLQGVVDKKYIPEMLRAGAAGGLMGGVLLGGMGGMYGSYEVNSRLNPTHEKLKNINTIGSLGLVGALGGGLIGMAGRGIQLALEKQKAKEELENLKSASAKDYAVHGLGGAAIGTAAGAVGNLALGRDMLDHRLLLGGMGLGAAAGLFSGHIRSKEREQSEKFDQAIKLSYRIGKDGKPIKLANGEFVPRNGTYIVLRPLNYGAVPADYVEGHPAFMNNAAHGFYVTFTDRPITTKHKLEDGNQVVFKSVKYIDDKARPVYAFYHQLSNDASPRDDGVKFMSRSAINGTHVRKDTLADYKHNFNVGYGDVVHQIFNPTNRTANSMYGRIIPLQYDDEGDPRDAEKRFRQVRRRIYALNNRLIKNNGELGPYTLVEMPWNKWMGDTNNCLTFLVYLTRQLERRRLINTAKTRHLIPRYLGIAFSADTQNKDGYQKVFGDFD